MSEPGHHDGSEQTAGNSGLPEGRELFACPHCGHQLSMFKEPQSGRGEKAAARVADVVGSWPFLLFLVFTIVAWCLANVFIQVFDPHPSAMFAYLGTILTVIAVMQGPLILLTQRREADRDRARDIEAFYISQNTEADLHKIRHAIGATPEQSERTLPPDDSHPSGGDREVE